MRSFVTLLAGATLAIWSAACWPQAGAGGPNFPARPVRMVVGFPPGGGTDIIARIVAQKLGGRWGQPVVVENRAGAGGNIATELVAKGAPDGYTLLMAFSSHASNPALYGKLPFDIDKDFTSLTLIGSAPMVVAASPALPATGEIEITYVAVLTGLQHFRAGKLSPLAVASRSRYPALPEVPTAAEAGLKGYEIDFWYALLGPARIPAPLVARIQRDTAAVLMTPEMRESLLVQGCVAVGSGPDELSARIKSDYELWSKVIKTAGVKLE